MKAVNDQMSLALLLSLAAKRLTSGWYLERRVPAGVFVDIRRVGWRAADNPLDAFQHFSLDGACTPPPPSQKSRIK
jgi:hypothetical protein